MSDRGKQSLLAGFEEFIMWGNVIGLAVAVGGASSRVVNCVVNGIMNPLVGPFGTKGLAGYSSCLKGPYVINEKGEATGGIHILWVSVLGATLTFVVIGAGVYALMVLPMARYPRRREARQQWAEIVESAKAEVGETTRLRDIHDALAAPRSGGTG